MRKLGMRDFERKLVKLVKVRAVTYGKRINSKNKLEVKTIYVHLIGNESNCDYFDGDDCMEKGIAYYESRT